MQKRDRDELWRRYSATKDSEARAELIEEYLGLVYDIAQKMARRMPDTVELSELVSAGSIGLMKAIDSYNERLGFAFSTYAVPRIRGAILDDLRSRDHASRSNRKHEREIMEAKDALRQSLGREPLDTEVAGFLGVDLDRYWAWCDDIAARDHVSLDGKASSGEDDDSLSYRDIVPDNDTEDPSSRLEGESVNQILRDAISELPHQERLVLALYYYEELKLSEIGRALELTESRISQIRSKAVRSLRSRLNPSLLK